MSRRAFLAAALGAGAAVAVGYPLAGGVRGAMDLGEGGGGGAGSDAPPFDAERAYGDLGRQVEFGARVPGSAPHVACRDWLRAELVGSLGAARLQPFAPEALGGTVPMWNVLAEHDRANPRQVLLAAHWDTRPTADEDPDPANRGSPIPGANDGASGVAVLLEVARALEARPPDVGVRFVLFDGEDYGPGADRMYLGAKHYAADPPGPHPDWGVLLDMVGDLDLDIWRERYSEEGAPKVNDRVWAAAEAGRHAGLFHDAPKWRITDDHLPLLDAGIPIINVIDFDYPHWHTLEDTPDKCSAASLGAVGETVLEALYGYAVTGRSAGDAFAV